MRMPLTRSKGRIQEPNARKEWLLMAGIVGLMAFLVFAGVGWANKAAVTIVAPQTAAKGEEIVIKLYVKHNANNYFHYVNWVYLKANGVEVKRWEFSSKSLPEGHDFMREFKYKVEGDTKLEAEANCVIHGSAGPALATVKVGSP